MNFGVVDSIRNLVNSVLHAIPESLSESSEDNDTIYFPVDQTSPYVVPTYIPVSSEGIQQQGEVSTLPQGSVNDTVEYVLEARALIVAPLIDGKCENGYRLVKGRCKMVYGKRRRRR
jgi:hypothetical protein